MMADGGKEHSAKIIARFKADIMKHRLEGRRPRSPDGTPEAYTTLTSNITETTQSKESFRKSRSVSDPHIPGCLVISGEEGLFGQRKLGPSKGTFGPVIINHGNVTAEERPTFIDSSDQAKLDQVNNRKTMFEKDLSLDVSSSQPVADFLNPLHKANRGLRPKKTDVLPKPAKRVKSPVAPKPVLKVKPQVAHTPEQFIAKNNEKELQEKDIQTPIVLQEFLVSSEPAVSGINDSDKIETSEKDPTTSVSTPEFGKPVNKPLYPLPCKPVTAPAKIKPAFTPPTTLNGEGSSKVVTLFKEKNEEDDKGIQDTCITVSQQAVEEISMQQKQRNLQVSRNSRCKSDPTPLDRNKTETKFYVHANVEEGSVEEQGGEDLPEEEDDDVGWDSDEFDDNGSDKIETNEKDPTTSVSTRPEFEKPGNIPSYPPPRKPVTAPAKNKPAFTPKTTQHGEEITMQEKQGNLQVSRNSRCESDLSPLDRSVTTGTTFYVCANVEEGSVEEQGGEDLPEKDDVGWDSDEFGDDDTCSHVSDDASMRPGSQASSNEGDALILVHVFPDARSKKLFNIAHEILTTERAYVRRLHLLNQVFYFRLDNECRAQGLIPPEVMQDVFSNIKAIHMLHSDFLLPKLEERMSQWSTNSAIGDILKTLAPFLKLYVAYIANFEKANETLSTWTKRVPKFASIIEEIQRTRESENLTLQHHMLGPIQRVPRYKLLLTDYIGKLAEDSPDMKNTQDALDIIAEAARHANDSMKKTERFQKLLEIQERLHEEYDLITASREFVKEGDLIKVAARSQAGHQERTLLLFNDVVLCCAKFPGTNKLKVKVAMDLDGMEIGDADDVVETPNTFRITSIKKVMDFSASSEEERDKWVNSLKEAIAEVVRKRDSYRRGSQVEVMSASDLGKKAPAWVRDESVTMCMLCDALFTITRRRHHCRACGRIYCSNCCHFKAPLVYCGNKLNRVCQTCHTILVGGLKESSVRKKVEAAQSMDVKKISSGTKVLLSGYLSYRGGSDKNWVRRWCVLSDSFVFFSYKAKKDTKAAFTLPLPGYVVDKPNMADDIDKDPAFKLHHKNVVVHFFAPEGEESLKRWMHHLSYAVKAEKVPEEKAIERPAIK